MTTTWSHLPNAAHIDRILASIKSDPDEWVRAEKEDIASHDVWAVAWNEIQDIVEQKVRTAELNSLYDCINVVKIDRWGVAKDAIDVLVAYDDCAYMLDSDPGELAIIAKLGDHRAILLFPACIALSKEKSK